MARSVHETRLNQTIRLRDGRTLGYAEYGDPSGVPVLFFHGTPGSRLMAVPDWDDSSLGLRIVVPDRPGIGLSDQNRDRTILNWADDVCELTDHLALARFVVAGVSGGGPHSLACAYALPDRVIRAGVISGAAPFEGPKSLEGMHAANRLAFTLATRTPLVMRALFAVTGFATRRLGDRALKSMDKQLPEADRAIVQDPAIKAALATAAPEAYRRGSRAVADEAILFTKPWGFRLEDVTVPVVLWHGGQDKNAPLQMAKDMELRIPDCTATYYPDEGHLYFMRRWPEIARGLKGEA
jgi:pimeloyl-ACP methyl ester carboxylesterase